MGLRLPTKSKLKKFGLCLFYYLIEKLFRSFSVEGREQGYLSTF